VTRGWTHVRNLAKKLEEVGMSYFLAYCFASIIPSLKGAQVVLEIKGETQLRNLATKLREAGVGHKLWVEQPEDFATALATAPARKSEVAHHFKKLKLCKGA